MLRKHGYFIFCSMMLVALVAIAFPYFQYYIDPDATAYLTLAKRYAAGDWQKAINGYWSPWSVWLTAGFIRLGYAPFASAILVNTLGALGFLSASYLLFLRFDLAAVLRKVFLSVLPVFLLYAIFWQSFDDLWECFFLLVVLLLFLHPRFLDKAVFWVVAGLAATLAYYAKAYALPFFLLELLVFTFFVWRKREAGYTTHPLKVALVIVSTLFVFTLPWLYLLHQKYGFWTTGTAGTLNTSWYLVGHPYWKSGIGPLLPPVYSDSPSYWEDPYWVNGPMPQFWSSGRLFLLQCIKFPFNLLKFVKSINELTCFFSLTLLFAVYRIFLSKKLPERDKLLVLSFLLFPTGYWLINFQARYLWYMLPLSMVLIGQITARVVIAGTARKWLTLLWIVIGLSYCVEPVSGLKSMFREGERAYTMAQQLKQLHLQGSFTSNIPYGPATQHLMRLAWFSGNAYYNLPVAASRGELLEEMRRYHVKYYFHYYDAGWSDFQLRNEQGEPYPEMTGDSISGLKVFLVN